jgi:hypothetical protein
MNTKRAQVAVDGNVPARDARPLVAVAAALATFVVVTPSCKDDTVECACNPEGFTVTLSSDGAGGAGETSQLVASGPACMQASVECTSPLPAGACASYRVVPTAPGTCHVDLFFSGGTDDEQDVDIVQESGCCAGFYADPPSAGQVEFPFPGVPDAGAVDA